MRSFLRFVGIVIILVGLGLLWQNHLYPQLAHNAFADRLLHPLDTRLRYRFAQVDPRFDLTSDDLKQLGLEAEAIWEQGLGRDVLVYDPKARLTINLIYDQRQADSNERKYLQDQLGGEHEQHNQQVQSIEAVKRSLQSEQRLIEAEQADLQHAIERYEDQLQQWQNSDRNPSLAQQMDDEQRVLRDRQAQLRDAIARYNEAQSALNARIASSNSQANAFNASVRQYRQKFAPVQFDKGQFDGRKIDIFEFEHRDDLRLTIAHELGHALGMKHNNDPEALMYPLLDAQNMAQFRLRAADVDLFLKR